ncbi:tetratricopeptide repeat protein [Microcoleus sp. w1-18aA5]|uniref:tetratricopeptide repeat protein n=1 Tax=Microcoleus sp. w1-18aA5 TaxID=2818982 RepID=UPI002FD0C047
MDSQQLRQLISQPEGLKLDFKRELHKLKDSKKDYAKQQCDEFIRDILSLTNGNFNTADQTGYLIIGVGDELRSDGTRDLFDVSNLLTPKQILQRVNPACEPPIPDVHCEIVEIDGKNIFVISIPPSPHLHRTIRDLTPRTTYPAGTVFIRRNEEIFPATPAECDVILREKERVFAKPRREKYDNLTRSSVVEFVGREQDIEKLDELFQQQNNLPAVTIIGMGGVGKTALADRYGQRHLEGLGDGAGGVCWIDVRNGDVGLQIVSFARSLLNLKPPEDLDLPNQLRYCWQNWPLGDVLIAFDDVTDYKQEVKPYLPPKSSGFKVLITSREQLGRGLAYLPLNELKTEAALRLLEVLIEDLNRFQLELDVAEQICEWLGYLPLGLELVGCYLYNRRDLSLEAMLSLLEEKRLKHIAVQKPDPTMTAQLGVAAAFELSWERLDENAQKLGCMLSLFALADIPWWLVKGAYHYLLTSEDEKIDLELLEEARADLLNCHLLKSTSDTACRLHPLIREFLRGKREESIEVNELKEAFVNATWAVADQIPESPTYQRIQIAAPAIPHVAEIAKDKDLRDLLNDKYLTVPFVGLGRFYEGQGLYAQALPWFEQCLSVTRSHFGSEHSQVATSLSNLACAYKALGRYSEVEPLLVEALELDKRLLGEQNVCVSISLINLASLYNLQGRYDEAETMFLQALELSKYWREEDKTLLITCLNHLVALYFERYEYEKAKFVLMRAIEESKDCSDVNHLPNLLNYLARIYKHQQRDAEAEKFYKLALEITKQLVGENHPDIAKHLNNLALFYLDRSRHSEAESLFIQALELTKSFCGEEHLDVATVQHHLADLYDIQGRYGEAEPLHLKALEIRIRSLGEEHPDVATSLNDLAYLYDCQGHYSQAEPLFIKAFKIRESCLGKDHIQVKNSLNNLVVFYLKQERYSEAEPLMLRLFKILQRKLGSKHPETIYCQESLAMLRQNLNYAKRDLPYFEHKSKKGKSPKKRNKFWEL